jgi:peptide deformylase
MAVKDILFLGDPLLYAKSVPVKKEEVPDLLPMIAEMYETVAEFRTIYGNGRAIAAPQLGLLKRIICLNIDKPITIINPELSDLSNEMIELWDDCMSFPGLLVRLKRHKSLRLSFYDSEWNRHEWYVEDDMAELIQHEYDHLDGILAIQKAIDHKSFIFKKPERAEQKAQSSDDVLTELLSDE